MHAAIQNHTFLHRAPDRAAAHHTQDVERHSFGTTLVKGPNTQILACVPWGMGVYIRAYPCVSVRIVSVCIVVRTRSRMLCVLVRIPWRIRAYPARTRRVFVRMVRKAVSVYPVRIRAYPRVFMRTAVSARVFGTER